MLGDPWKTTEGHLKTPDNPHIEDNQARKEKQPLDPLQCSDPRRTRTGQTFSNTETDARGLDPTIVLTLKLPPKVTTRNYCMIKFPRTTSEDDNDKNNKIMMKMNRRQMKTTVDDEDDHHQQKSNLWTPHTQWPHTYKPAARAKNNPEPRA